jgi:hypothetical protein
MKSKAEQLAEERYPINERFGWEDKDAIYAERAAFIAGYEAGMKHVEESKMPTEVEKAYKYVNDCHADFGFMGSAEYDRQRKIIADYKLKNYEL